MGSLSSKDYQRILDLTAAILNTGERYLPWRLVSQELRLAIPNEGGVLFWTQGWMDAPPDDFPAPYARTSDDLFTPPVERAFAQHPLVRHHQAGPEHVPRVLEALPDSGHWTDERARYLVRGMLGEGPHFALPLPAPPGEGHLILLHRDGTAFTSRDLELGARLEPLLAAIVNHQCTLLRWRTALSASDCLPDRVDEYSLTPRELTVLTLLSDALTAEAIGRRLGISPRTVHKHVERLYRKMGTRDRVETILRAQAAGILPQAHPAGP
ncbi:helix-turn-helix transcriptional regulator [Streptosporangiaceae bacterium NEAU-GS5]|nr:helix-turn-helix transcriptional regulator [Streptosporangiaceae bacterium NEAU-GS5]